MRFRTGRTLLVAGATATLILAGSSAALAQKPSGGTAVISGNTARGLIANSTLSGPAPAAAQVDLLLGLKYVNPASGPSLPQFITDTVTPSSPYFHRYFQTAAAFANVYDQPAANVAALEAYLATFGISVTRVYSNRIEAVGQVGQVEGAFSVSINAYEHGGHSYFANQEDPSLPTAFSYGRGSYNLAGMVSGISGMTTYSAIHTESLNLSQMGLGSGGTCQTQGTFCAGPQGYSPQQIDSAYQVPSTVTGQGVTIAVATLAPLTNTDATNFWASYGIDRTGSLSQLSVDGAAIGQAVAGAGSSETSLDVERSGAMAPGANIVAYVAPNTNNGFVDLYDTVVSQDQAQVVTTSWGEAEQDETKGYAILLNQAFEQGAAEGMSMFAASGDYGAYDAYPQYNTLAVDSPGSSPYVTAAGGTTLPSSSQGVQIAAATATAPAVYGGPTSEAAWGWSYLLPYYQALGLQNQEQAHRSFYPIGSGGGYSLYFAQPSWQQGFQGSGQRGVPDVALNADPFTGYAIYDSNSTYSNATSPWSNGWGGTSFAAPQWAGITALLDQAEGGPIGFASQVFYSLPASGGTVAGFRDIAQGNNWGYQAGTGWDPTTGLGVPDVTKLASAIQTYDGGGATAAHGHK